MACYLINRSPRASLGGRVAEEVWISNAIDFDHLRIFGCPAYVHVPGDERSKLDPKSKKCIFLGYKKGVKGYKFWDLIARKVVTSRDAVFDEQFMLQQDQDKVPENSSSSDTLHIDLEPYPVAIERVESSNPTSGGSNTDDLQNYNLARDRQRRTNVRPPRRLGYEDIVSFALLITSDDPATFQEAITNREK